MSEAAPPKPPNPVEAVKHAHKGIKGKLSGHPKWVYIAGGVVLIGVAFMVWQRSRANSDGGTVAGDATAGPSPDSSYYPDATQGAFGGYSDPGFLDPTGQLPESQGTQAVDPTPIVINVGQPAPTTQDAVSPAPTVPAMPTGGGTAPARTVAAHATPGAFVATLSPKVVDEAPPPGMGGCPKAFPNKGPHGCFSREYDAHRKRHYHQYQSGLREWL